MKISLFTKITAVLSILLLGYGYSCRAFDIYFFWESKTIGWIIFKLALIGILMDFISIRKQQEKKSIFLKIGIGIIVFVFIIKSILLTVFYSSEAYAVSKNYFLSDLDVKKNIGEIHGFSLNAMGSIKKETVNGISLGNAEINFTIKGDERYIDTTVWLFLNEKGEWVIEGITLWD